MRFTRTSDDPMDPCWRLAVEDEDGAGLITISEEDISSPALTAQTTGIRGAIDLNSDQARWLYFALGKLLLARENFDPHAIHGVDDEQANQIAAHVKRATNEMHKARPHQPTLTDVIRESKLGASLPTSADPRTKL